MAKTSMVFDEKLSAKKWAAFTRQTHAPVRESAKAKAKRDERMAWWRDARFGMFVHWGLYSQIQRHEWVMNRERIPVKEYERYARSWKVKPGFAREWVSLAKRAGMKYIVLTTKHHEGFSLWDSQLNPYNAVRLGPGRDLVAEFVTEARRAGLRVGLYYSLMDWHHPDGEKCAIDREALQRFTDYTHGLVRELMTGYGRIDILWYDVPWPLNAEQWRSRELNRMVRRFQPEIIINDRSYRVEDFTTPEEAVKPARPGRDWEACFTFNGSWGYMPTLPEEWLSARAVVKMLQRVTAGGGNLVLNIGPLSDGSVCPEAVPRLKQVGQWVKLNEEAIRGATQPVQAEWTNHTAFSVRGHDVFFWIHRWQVNAKGELTIGGIRSRIHRVTFLATGKGVRFKQDGNQLVLKGLPRDCPDRNVYMVVLKAECEGEFRHLLGPGYQEILLKETMGHGLFT